MMPPPDTYQAIVAESKRALALADADRSEFLERLRSEAPDLAADVVRYLADHERALCEAAEVGPPSRAWDVISLFMLDGPPLSGRVGDYQIEKRIGKGGFADVYLGRLVEGRVGPKVAAVKVLRPGLNTPEVLRRFRLEQTILGRFNDERIARIINGGVIDGRPYFVMELVDGVPITEHCAANDLPIRKRLELFRYAADAVHHAHVGNVVHGDLKPANILVTPSGRPKLLDFGISRSLAPDEDGNVTDQAMTPAYASPEQADGGPTERRSDVYALGVILYELLTGRLPYELPPTVAIGTGQSAALAELRRIIREHSPDLPSRVALRRGPSARRDLSHRRLRGDLDAIIMKALAKEPKDRYESARALSDDLNDYLRGRPVAARRPFPYGYRARKVITNPQVAIPTGIIAALTTLAVWAAAERSTALRALHATDVALGQRTAALSAERVAKRNEAVARYRAQAELERARSSLYSLQLNMTARLADQTPGDALALLVDLERCPEDLREFAWRLLYRRCCRDRLTIQAHEAEILLVAFSADNRVACSAAADGILRRWNPDTGAPLGDSRAAGRIVAAASSADRKVVATATDRGLIELWDPAYGRTLSATDTGSDTIYALTLAHDGSLFATLSDGWKDVPCRVEVWTPGSARPEHAFKGPIYGSALAIAPTKVGLIVGGRDEHMGGLFQLWDARTGERLAEETVDLVKNSLAEGTGTGLTGSITELNFARQGAELFLGSQFGALGRFDLGSGRIQAVQVPGGGFHLALSPDDEVVVTSGQERGQSTISHQNRSLSLWSARPLGLMSHLAVVVGSVHRVALSGEGLLATGGRDGSLTIFDTREEWACQHLTHENGVGQVAYTPDNATLVAVSNVRDGRDGRDWEHFPIEIKRWPTSGGDPEVTSVEKSDSVLVLPGGRIVDLGWTPQPRELRSPHVLDVLTGRTLGSLPLRHQGAQPLAASPDGALMACAGGGNAVDIWEVAKGDVVHVLAGLRYPPTVAAFSPDGAVLATGGGGMDQAGEVRLWEVKSGTPIASIEGLDVDPTAMAFSRPDGRYLALGLNHAFLDVRTVGGSIVMQQGPIEVVLWDSEERREIWRSRGHSGLLYSIDFSPDGRTIATGGMDRSVKLWDARYGNELATLSGHIGTVFSVAFSPDGDRLASGSFDTTVRVWQGEKEAVVAARHGRLQEALGTKAWTRVGTGRGPSETQAAPDGGAPGRDGEPDPSHDESDGRGDGTLPSE